MIEVKRQKEKGKNSLILCDLRELGGLFRKQVNKKERQRKFELKMQKNQFYAVIDYFLVLIRG